MTDPATSRIREALARLEAERGVRVLFACETGDRAWGFAPDEGVRDARFIYVHQRDWYLSVDNQRDAIMLPAEPGLDLCGWELRKALRLLRKSNPPLLEWLRSPVVYQYDPGFVAQFGALATEFYSPRQSFRHYLHMAWGSWRDSLRNKRLVSLKKYLYVFRPLLACRWIEQVGSQVPVQFARLVEGVLHETVVRSALEDLLARCREGGNLAVAPPVELLSHYIKDELLRLTELAEPEESEGDVEALNGLFRYYALAP